MPVAIPLAMMAASTAVSAYGAKKASKAAKLPAAQQAAQDAAAAETNRRMLATNPIYDRLIAGVGQRLPASYGGTTTGTASPRARMRYDAMPEAGSGTTQAVQALARGMGRGADNGRIIWGDRRERGGSAY